MRSFVAIIVVLGAFVGAVHMDNFNQQPPQQGGAGANGRSPSGLGQNNGQGHGGLSQLFNQATPNGQGLDQGTNQGDLFTLLMRLPSEIVQRALRDVNKATLNGQGLGQGTNQGDLLTLLMRLPREMLQQALSDVNKALGGNNQQGMGRNPSQLFQNQGPNFSGGYPAGTQPHQQLQNPSGGSMPWGGSQQTLGGINQQGMGRGRNPFQQFQNPSDGSMPRDGSQQVMPGSQSMMQNDSLQGQDPASGNPLNGN